MGKRVEIGTKVYSSDPKVGVKLPKNMNKIAAGYVQPIEGTNDWKAEVPFIEIGNDKTYLSAEIVKQINAITIPETKPETN